MSFPNVEIFPATVAVTEGGHLSIGGCDVEVLAAEFGTPLYVFDEATLRGMCRDFVNEFTARYANTKVVYASKAYINPALARLVHEEGLGLDVVSGGELAVAAASGVPMSEVYFHGNNKSPEELEMAVDAGIGRVVVDSFYELGLLDAIAEARGTTQDIMLRLSPGIDPPHPCEDDDGHPG